MAFTKLSPQRVKSSEGFIIQVLNRFAVEYIDSDLVADVEVEFGNPVFVYRERFKWISLNKEEGSIPEQAKAKILGRIIAGLEAMGTKAEIRES